ncbi:hypothetical protein BDN70DRAFT_931408 [Pholiota conissans]|uniref:Protein BIG1 n=1 Tax=Pholiota conissans TaxID=109636 RepID=A0A9P6D252_9AGAR|nr:hypothetical protein BDN70DRAFT_931408 [Pholiota conissans]
MAPARLLIVAAVAHAALAYSNTAPVVAWSSSSSVALEELPSSLDASTHTTSLIESIVDSADICSHDAVVLIEQPGLHASDLRVLSPDTHLRHSLDKARSSKQYPYIPIDTPFDLAALGSRVSSKCGSQLVQYAAGEKAHGKGRGKKHVVCMKMPHLSEKGPGRNAMMHKHESLLASELNSIASTFPNHIIIYTGSSSPSHHHKRQESTTPDRPILDLSNLPSAPLAPATNTTLPTGGILKRYQLLTPALITGLLVVFFILVPVLYFSLGALSSIQTPIRGDVGKTFSATEKKNQ